MKSKTPKEWGTHIMQFYPFGFEQHEDAGSVELLGGKGAGLVWLANHGVPVPPGFVIPTTVWAEYDKKPKATMKAIAKALPAYLAKLEAHFGYMPLLSVRSGARKSCPGMMDTILNVGIDPDTLTAWAARLGPQCFADSFKRLVVMYGSVVHGMRKSEGTLKEVLDTFQEKTGAVFPDAEAQVLNSIEAVFKSWDNDRAAFYRKDHGYDRAWGTAVTVQAMVFGNLNEQSATGVVFTRNPDTGVMAVTGEWLPNAQGEDIVAGVRTPQPLEAMKAWSPVIHDALLSTVLQLENLKRDVLDIEFTIQDGSLYLLQVRAAKRSHQAAIRIATDFVKQGVITPKEAVQRVGIRTLDEAQQVQLDPTFDAWPAFTGISACSGVVSGKPVFTKEDAINCTEPCILVTTETTPDDIAGMKAAVGIVTMTGGLTCHAAVNARNMNRSCIVGVGAAVESFKGIDVLSLDGATGRIWTEKIPVIQPQTNGLIRDFHAMAVDALNVVPVIFATPKYPMKEALLYLGDQILDPAKAVTTVLQTLGLVSKLYLDLVPSAGEAPYLKLLTALDPTRRVLDLLHAAIPQSDAALVLIVGTEYTTSFQRITPGTDLRSLVLSDKEMTLSPELDMMDPAIQRVLAWKTAEKIQVVSLGTYLPAAKSMISVNHALQVLGNEGG